MSKRIVVNQRYELEPSPAAKGGMGEVWFGHDIKLDRPVAVKFVRFPEGAPDDALTRRFVRETRIAARLQHPGVPAVYDAGVHEGRPFLVMQRINGISVADLIAEHERLPVGWAAAIATQVCAVLAVAHATSLVHRDLKPRNLMLEPDGGVKVLDFGLAAAVGGTEYSTITSAGHAVGTPAYMAPEQISAGISGPASDLYALGCTLYEMLCGRAVFAGSTAYTIMNKQVDEPAPAVRDTRPEVPAALDELVLDLLAKKPEDRPPTADAVYQRLLPFAVDLGPLPGALNPPTAQSPVRMYARALSRVYADAPAAPTTEPVPTPNAAGGPPSVAPPAAGGERSGEVLQEAHRLVKERRYSQAASVLSTAIQQAEQTEDTTRLRREYADALFESGDYRNAAPEYRRLAEDLAKRRGAADEADACRLREATCLALLGETSLALTRLHQLLEDQRARLGDSDERVLQLRQQIGLLQLGAGQRRAAESTLSELLADLRALRAPDHPSIAGTADLLARLRRTSHH